MAGGDSRGSSSSRRRGRVRPWVGLLLLLRVVVLLAGLLQEWHANQGSAHRSSELDKEGGHAKDGEELRQ